MKRLVLVSLFAACGTVQQPDEGDPTSPESFEGPLGEGRHPYHNDAPPPPPPPPLLIEAPRAATSPSSLFGISFATNDQVLEVVRAMEGQRIDVVEQRIVKMTDEPVQVSVELAPPTGTFSRVIVSDTVRIGTRTDHVMCEMHGIASFRPECETAAPAARETPMQGEITASSWRLWMIDEATGTPAGACVTEAGGGLACTLAGPAGASYRLVASAYGFADLWDGSAALGSASLAGLAFTGAIAAQSDWQCWDWRYTTNAAYCATRYEFTRFYAIDGARLELDPITTRISAAGSASVSLASPALTWDAGTDDLPGAY